MLATPYATKAASAQVLKSGAEFRKNRCAQPDMLSTTRAAALAGTSRVTIVKWIYEDKCLAVTPLRRGYRLPAWQFEPYMHGLMPALQKALGTSVGWAVLAFLENGQSALGGASPQQALAAGSATQAEILKLAETSTY